MDCPRCGGPLEEFALEGHQARNCRDCGWVGTEASLAEETDGEPSESWDVALTRATDGWASDDRTRRPMPPIGPTESDTDGAPASERQDTGAGGAASGGRDTGAGGEAEDRAEDDSEDAVGVAAIDGIDETDREQLRAVDIRTVSHLASADPVDIAEGTDISETDAREYVRTASIQFVTDDSG